MQAIHINTHGQVEMVTLESPVYQSLEKLLGGMPEHVLPRRLPQPYCMFVDDEGLRKELPVNLIGSYLYETDKHGNPIVGDIYILKDRWASDGYSTIGLNDSDIARLSPWFTKLVGKAQDGQNEQQV